MRKSRRQPSPMAQLDWIRVALETLPDPSLREAALKDLSDVVATMRLTDIRFTQLNGMIPLDERGNPATQAYVDALLDRCVPHGRYAATRPLRTEQDYFEAKARLEKIDATVERGTPEGDEFELLSLLISDWENV